MNFTGLIGGFADYWGVSSQASSGVGAKEGDLRSPRCFSIHPLKVANRRIPSTPDQAAPLWATALAEAQALCR